MEKLIILLLFGIGSAAMNWFQKKQKEQEEKKQADEVARRGGSMPPTQPVPRRTENPAQWAEELRRLLEGKIPREEGIPRIPPVMTQGTLAPIPSRQPVVRSSPPVREMSEGDVIIQSPLTTSSSAYQRAASLQEKVEARMKSIDDQTQKHTRKIVVSRRRTRSAREMTRSWKQNREVVKEALIASIIIGRPVGL